MADTPAGTVNGFDPEVNVSEQDTICPDWLHPGGSAADDAAGTTTDTTTAAANVASAGSGLRPRRDNTDS
jgi:hypothetical protein